MESVHIVVPERGKFAVCARRLVARLPYVSAGTEPNWLAGIQYYLPHAMREERVSSREAAFYESGLGPPSADIEAWIASEKDAAVPRKRGMAAVTPLAPPVAEIHPLHMGTVGAVPGDLAGTPGSLWHSWGARRGICEDFGLFCASLDAILLQDSPDSALVAGLAQARAILAPEGVEVGVEQVWRYDGSEAGLRAALTDLAAARALDALHEEAWDAWVAGHDAFFRNLAAGDVGGGQEHGAGIRAGLCVGAHEKHAMGGPHMLVPRTALELGRLGAQSRLETCAPLGPEADLYHIFNVWPPERCYRMLAEARRTGKRVVLSTIYLDLSEQVYFDRLIPELFRAHGPGAARDAGLAALRTKRAAEVQAGQALRECRPGYFRQVRELVGMADHVILHAALEGECLEAIGAKPKTATVVLNPTAHRLFGAASPDLFVERYGVRDFVLCVGRIEGRKNQLLLLEALRPTGLPVVIIGHTENQKYLELVRAEAGPDVLFVDRIPPNSPLLASAYAACRVFALPSWSEGAPYVAIEAAAAGRALALSNRSSEREYYGELARYCDPFDPASIRAAVLAAWDDAADAKRAEALQSLVRERHTWERYARKTLAVYKEVLAASPRPAARERGTRRIYFDLTQNAYYDGPPNGIARVEWQCALAATDVLGERVTFVVHHRERRVFLAVSTEAVRDGAYKDLVRDTRAPLSDALPGDVVAFERDAVFLMMGGRWLSAGLDVYFRDVTAVKHAHGLTLVTTLHDVIRAKFPGLYPDDLRAAFEERTQFLLAHTDLLVTSSACAARDIGAFCEANNLVTPAIARMRLGDAFDSKEGATLPEVLDGVLPLPGFVFCVSAFDVRKNHALLLTVWRRLVEEYGEAAPHLVCAGEESAHAAALRMRYLGDPGLAARVHLLHSADDAALGALYRECLFSVYPSFYEGWGMPVAESLAIGKICVASSAASIPEIAPALCDLAHPLDEEAWYLLLSRYAFDPEARQAREAAIAAGFVATSWHGTLRGVIDAIDNYGGRGEAAPVFASGDTLSFRAARGAHEIGMERVHAGGWYAPGPKGAWTHGGRSELLFQTEALGAPHVLLASARPFLPAGVPAVRAQVRLDGAALADWEVSRQGLYRALLPRGGAQGRLAFAIENPMRPADFGVSDDRRPLGLEIETVRILPAAVVPADGPVDFAAPSCTLAEHMASGWLAPDSDGLVMCGPNAVLCCERAAPATELLLLRMVLRALPPRQVPRAHVRLTLNGHALGRVAISGSGEANFEMLLPLEFLDGAPRFVLDFATSDLVPGKADPAALDCGVRSIALRSLAVMPVADAPTPPGYRLGSTLQFGAAGDAARHAAGGWRLPRPRGMASLSRFPALRLGVGTGSGPLRLRARLRGDVHALRPVVRVTVVANGVSVAVWTLDRAEMAEREAILGEEVISGRDALTIVFRIEETGNAPREGGPACSGFVLYALCVTGKD